MGIIKQIAKKILEKELLNEYIKGWEDGVMQNAYEPNTCIPHTMDEWPTENEYFSGEK